MRLQTLEVQIRRTDKSEAWGQQEFRGYAKFKTPDFAFIELGVVDGNNIVPAERIVCDGKRVWQYKHKEKQIFIYPLGKQQRRALEEGPLPFLFNFSKDDAKRRYALELKRFVDDGKGQAYYVIAVTPLLTIDQQEFSLAYIQLDARYLLPTMLYLVGPNQKSQKRYDLSDIKPNNPNWKGDEFFRGRLYRGYKVEENGGAPAGNPAAAVRAPNAGRQ
jgi:TIGR03009 family protein